MKSSSTIKVVDQESISRENSKPISREIQSNQHKQSKSAKKKSKEIKKKYQASAAEPQLKVATLKRS